MRTVIVLLLVFILLSLGQALFSMASGPDPSGRMVRALTVRITLSLALFGLLFVGWHLGLIAPVGSR
jgi:hypothetical protein